MARIQVSPAARIGGNTGGDGGDGGGGDGGGGPIGDPGPIGPPEYDDDTVLLCNQQYHLMQAGRRRQTDLGTLQAFGIDTSQLQTLTLLQLNRIPAGLPLTVTSDRNLLQVAGQVEVDWMQAGARRPVPDADTLADIAADDGPVRHVSAAVFQSIPLGAPLPSRADGLLYKGSADPIFRMEQGVRRWIPDAETFTGMKLDWSQVRVLSDADLAAIPRGSDYPSVKNDITTIQHVVVVMIENRSFDHLLGYLKEQIPEIDGITAATESQFVNRGPNGPIHTTATASYRTLVDPGHELDDVNRQLHSDANGSTFGGTLDNAGFVSTYAAKVTESGFDPGGVMRCFHPSSLPALSRLAREFAVCDRWFSSLPGPTLPNRLFVHAGTCIGYARSPPANVKITSLLALPHTLMLSLAMQVGWDELDKLGESWVSSGVSMLGLNPAKDVLALLKIGAGAVVDLIADIGGSGATDHYDDVVKAFHDQLIGSNPDLAYFLGEGDVPARLIGPPGYVRYPETIYEKLERKAPGGAPEKAWRVYFQDFSETLLIPALRNRLFSELHVDITHPESPKPTGKFWQGQTGNFRTFEKFLEDALKGDLPQFSFVQPRFAQVVDADDLVETIRSLTGISDASPTIVTPVPNDGHPPHDVRDMEAFVAKVYDALRASPAWPNTMLVVTADEHGGFYDHVPPPTGVPQILPSYTRAGDWLYAGSFWHLPSDPNFSFDSLGVRVPAIVISPYVQAGSVNHTVFDHTSIGATLRNLFQLDGEFTDRMANANAFTTGLTWTPYRGDTVSSVSRLLPARAPGWSSLGGFAVDSPVVATNRDGRLEVFVRAATGEIHHLSETSPGGEWSSWAALSRLPSNVPRIVGTPAVGANGDGRLEVFVRGEGGVLLHAWQLSPGAALWSDYAELARGVKGDPLVAANADGRLEIFYMTDRGLVHRWQSLPTLAWSDEAVLDAPSPFPTTLAVGRAASGALVLFGASTASSSHIAVTQARWQDAGAPGGWTAWDWHGQNEGSDPVVLTTADGRLYVIAMKKDSSLQVLRQPAAGAPGPSGFPMDSAPPDDGFTIHAGAINAWGQMELVAFDTAGQLWQTRQDGMPAWKPWSLLGGPFGGRPALVRASDGRMVAFVIGYDNNIWVRRQSSAGIW